MLTLVFLMLIYIYLILTRKTVILENVDKMKVEIRKKANKTLQNINEIKKIDLKIYEITNEKMNEFYNVRYKYGIQQEDCYEMKKLLYKIEKILYSSLLYLENDYEKENRIRKLIEETIIELQRELTECTYKTGYKYFHIPASTSYDLRNVIE